MKAKSFLSTSVIIAGLLMQSGLMAQPTMEFAGGGNQVLPPAEHMRDMVGGGRSTGDIEGECVHWSARNDLKHLVRESDLVFHGVVRDIHYKLSEPTGSEQIRVPYTFVTYQVEDVFHGWTADDQVTLRFIGGLNEETMRYMESSITPQFDLGDEDILFVQGNTERFCPLVGNQSGRLRVIDGQVYTDTGRTVILGQSGRLGIGARHVLEEVMTTTVHGSAGTMVIRRGFDPDAVNGPSKAVTPEDMIDQIDRLDLELEPSASFVSADPFEFLPGPDMTPAPPPDAKPCEEVQSIEPEGEVDEGVDDMEVLERSE